LPYHLRSKFLSHLLYAFANVQSNGTVILSDPYADQNLHYDGDSSNVGGKDLYGNFKQIYLLKKQNRQLKLLLSIGGETYSPAFHPVVVSASLRARFVSSSIKLLEDYGLDGFDIDYEFRKLPCRIRCCASEFYSLYFIAQNDAQAKGYVNLLKELRAALDEHATQKGINYHYLLTIATSCGVQNYTRLRASEMDKYLDFWNLMVSLAMLALIS
jgi:chitinase